MTQKLIYPVNRTQITAGYQNDSPGYYTLLAGSIHYGVDFVGTSGSKRDTCAFFASGRGTVIDFNLDAQQAVGRWLIVKYFNVEGYGNLIARYFHLAEIYVKRGQSITIDTLLASYGNTGQHSKGKHLHIELDCDVKHPWHTPTLSGTSGKLRAGYRGMRDTTVNPVDVFYQKKSPPENQMVSISQSKNAKGERYMKQRIIKEIAF